MEVKVLHCRQTKVLHGMCRTNASLWVCDMDAKPAVSETAIVATKTTTRKYSPHTL